MTDHSRGKDGRYYPRGIYRHKIHFVIDLAMLARIDKFAKEIRASRSEATRVLLEKALEDSKC